MANGGIQTILGSDFLPFAARVWPRRKGIDVEVIHEWWALPNREQVNQNDYLPDEYLVFLRKLKPGENYQRSPNKNPLVYSGVVKVQSNGLTFFKFTHEGDPSSEEWLAQNEAASLVRKKEQSLTAFIIELK